MSDRVPFVSVIVPVYNGERNIGNCIKSLLALNYPASNLEIIIVDNNSKDGTRKVIQEFPVISLVEDRIQSSYAARNTGLKKAKGEIIAFTDSDCIADTDWILKAVECFQDGKVGCVAGRIEGYSPSNYIEEYMVRNGYLCQDTSTLKHWFLPYAQTANAIYRREVLDAIGSFEENWVSAGDSDLTWRMLLHTKYTLIYCQESLIYHVHRSSLKGVFNQRKTWGHGEVLLYKKYHVHYHNPEKSYFKEFVRDYKEFFRLVIGKFPAMIYNKFISKNEISYQDKKLAMIGALGRRAGRFRGSVREKKFYI
jgi:cellulose synthase/poly-beta-1,6-N-acetylglucosamine synthase-like glycosyltransferase